VINQQQQQQKQQQNQDYYNTNIHLLFYHKHLLQSNYIQVMLDWYFIHLQTSCDDNDINYC
jgi:hypothetical protein